MSGHLFSLNFARGVDKTRNMEHFGTSRNILEHRIIIIIMRKMCKIKFSKIKLNKNKLVSPRNIKYKAKTQPKRKRKMRKKLSDCNE